MKKYNAVAKSRAELEQELVEQLESLRLFCEIFDSGKEVAGKQIAVTLRILIYHYKRSKALLEQLGYRSGLFVSTIPTLDPSYPVSESPLLLMRISKSGIRWMPFIATGGHYMEPRFLSFTDWWLEHVIKDSKGKKFSRYELVAHVADTDGGAHVDPELDEIYMNLSRKNSLNWQFGPNGEPPMNRPELPCMRQIAHELLTTLQKFRPQLKDAAKPVIPPPILEEEEGVHYVMHGSSKELDAMPWPSNSFLSVDHKPG